MTLAGGVGGGAKRDTTVGAIRKTVITSMCTGAVVMAGLGAASYHGGVPANQVRFGSLRGVPQEPELKAAVIRGYCHVVLCRPIPAGAMSDAEWQFGPFSAKRLYWGATEAQGISIQFWVPLVVLLLYPGLATARFLVRQRGRRKRGECLQCGYCLRGLVEPRCPECGRPFAPFAASRSVAVVST